MLQPPEEPALKHTQLNTHTHSHTRPRGCMPICVFFSHTPRLLIYAAKPIGTVFTRQGGARSSEQTLPSTRGPSERLPIWSAKPRNPSKIPPLDGRVRGIPWPSVRAPSGGGEAACAAPRPFPALLREPRAQKSYVIYFLLPVDALRERLISPSAVGLRPWRCLPLSLIPSLSPSCRAKKKKSQTTDGGRY